MKSPHLNDIQTERALIGLLIRQRDAYFEIKALLTPKDFDDSWCGKAYDALDRLATRGTPFELPIIAHEMGLTEPHAVAEIARIAHGSAQIEGTSVVDLASIVADMSLRRTARLQFEEASKALALGGDANVILSGMQGQITDMLGRTNDYGGSLGDLARKVFVTATSPQKRTSLLCGLPFVDDLIGRMMAEDFIVLGGATAMGKSALAAQIALGAAPAVYFSQEMPSEQIATRFLAQESDIPTESIDSGELNPRERNALETAVQQLARHQLYIESVPRSNVSSILARAIHYQKKYDIKLVVVDHLHYLRSEAKRSKDMMEKITDIVMDIKAAAKQTKIPWLVLSHLNRQLNSRDDKRPSLGDLYGASEIEKSADIVFFVHRQEYWLSKSEPPEGSPARQQWQQDMKRWKGRAELILDKHRRRSGRATQECEFNGKRTMFMPISAPPDAPPMGDEY